MSNRKRRAVVRAYSLAGEYKCDKLPEEIVRLDLQSLRLQKRMGWGNIGDAEICGAIARVVGSGPVADVDNLLKSLECRHFNSQMSSLKEGIDPFLYALDCFPRLLGRWIITAMLQDMLVDGCKDLDCRLCMCELGIGEKIQDSTGSVY